MNPRTTTREDDTLAYLLRLARRLAAENDDGIEDAAEQGCRLAAEFLVFHHRLRRGAALPRCWQVEPAGRTAPRR